MADNKPIPLSTPQFASLAIVLNGELGVFNPGGLADEGYYNATIKEAGLSINEGKAPSLAVTLSGIGNGDVYTYITLPTDTNAEHFVTYQRLFNSFLASTGYDVAALANGTQVNLAWIEGFIGQPSIVYYYPPHEGPDGKLLNKTQEVFFQSKDQRSAVETQTSKPPARRHAKPVTIDHNALGVGVLAAAAASQRPVMPPAATPPLAAAAPAAAPAGPSAPSAPVGPPPPGARPMIPPPPAAR
jgi:hypothetical protein